MISLLKNIFASTETAGKFVNGALLAGEKVC